MLNWLLAKATPTQNQPYFHIRWPLKKTQVSAFTVRISRSICSYPKLAAKLWHSEPDIEWGKSASKRIIPLNVNFFFLVSLQMFTKNPYHLVNLSALSTFFFFWLVRCLSLYLDWSHVQPREDIISIFFYSTVTQLLNNNKNRWGEGERESIHNPIPRNAVRSACAWINSNLL